MFEQRESGAVLVRARDRANPRFLTVSRLRLSQSTHVHHLAFLDSLAPTLRSSPDHPGNFLLLDDRFDPPIPRRLHPWEEWCIMGGCEQKLDWLQDHSSEFITHNAGKRITGAMARYLGEHFSKRISLLKAASAVPQCISPDCEDVASSVLVILLHFEKSCVAVDSSCSLCPGFQCSRSRESAKTAVEDFIASSLGWKVDAYLAGEAGSGQRVYGCLVRSQARLPAHLLWKDIASLHGTPLYITVQAAAIRATEFVGAVPLELHPQFSAGVARSLASPQASRKHVATWEQHCHRANTAVARLRSAFADAFHPELPESTRLLLLSWQDKIGAFEPDSVPPALRGRIPAPGGWVNVPFPVVHKPHKTKWLPRKPAQPRFQREVSSLRELLCGIYPKLQVYLSQLDDWLDGKARRPSPLLISAKDAAEWSHGLVLDLRHLEDGWVRELDYTAPTPTLLNLPAIAERLHDFDDQELVSFIVLGVSYKAELPLQFVVLPHLLNILGYDEAVYRDVCKLEEFGWVGTFNHPPIWPCRANSKGQVPKAVLNPQDVLSGEREVRPVDDAGNPYDPVGDSRGDLVHSLNFCADGLDAAPEGTSKRASAQAKWPHENKPTAKDARTANGIISEGAALCDLDTSISPQI